MTGTVKSYSPQNGYGFITADDADYFVHAIDWEYRLPPTPGLTVEFVPKNTDKGLRATKIRRSDHGK
jgi:cold shock CspA family protein